MGEHKYNPIAIAAKKGELPPKERGISKREAERRAHQFIREMTGVAALERAMWGRSESCK